MELRDRRRQRSAFAGGAFALVELIVVIVIIGILAAVAVPRLSRGSQGAGESALDADLQIVRKAIQIYAAEHTNKFPGPTANQFVNQLTLHSKANGSTSAKRDSSHPFGPYLLAIPPCPVGAKAGNEKVLIDNVNSPPRAVSGADAGWVYNPKTGEFYANTAKFTQLGILLDGDAAEAAALEAK